MKQFFFSLLLSLISVMSIHAEGKAIMISQPAGNSYALLSAIDSIYYNGDSKSLCIQPVGGADCISIPTTEITGMKYISEAEVPSKVKIAFNGTTATAENPYLLSGVSIVMDGAYVTLNNANTSEEITTQLEGSTTDGAFTYNGTYKTTLELNGVSITSKQGAAIDIQCGKRVNVEIKKETVNTLVDAANGTQKAALYCKGHMEFDKAGTLNVTGNTKHAISAKEYILLKKSTGTINVLGSVSDGIHCNQYFAAKGFTVNVSGVKGDGIQAETSDDETYEEDYPNGSVQILDGNISVTCTQNGGVESSDTYSFTCLQADGNMNILGGTLNLKNTGSGGKGIKVGGELVIGEKNADGPAITVATSGAQVTSSSSSSSSGGFRPGGWGPSNNNGATSSAKGIKAVGQLTVNSGSLLVTTTTNGAEGMESKTSITINGGNHYLQCYDDCINSAGIINFAGGNTVCFATNNDAVDSNYGKAGAITISGGTIFAYSAAGSPEEGLDCDNNSYIKITGGIAISAGGTQGGGGGGRPGSSSSTTASVGSSTQGYYLGSAPSSYGTSYYYTLCNTSGEAICTYKFEKNITNSLSLLTAPNLGKGSITVKYGTAAPTASAAQVCNASGKAVFFSAPTVTTSGTTTTVTAK